MKKGFICFVFFISLVSFNALAQEPQNKLTVELLFAKKSHSAMTAPKPKLKPQEVSGSVIIDIAPYPAKIEKDRYFAEYFLDKELFYQTSGINEQNPERVFFSCVFDTTEYKNGPHKLIVNFWDESGPSAIGIREIIINNLRENK